MRVCNIVVYSAQQRAEVVLCLESFFSRTTRNHGKMHALCAKPDCAIRACAGVYGFLLYL